VFSLIELIVYLQLIVYLFHRRALLLLQQQLLVKA
jgi:hypothetical protein